MAKWPALAATCLLPLTGHAAPTPCKPVALDLLLPHAGVMLGEVHGTREAPAFMEQVLCSVAAHRPVVLALEYPRAEQAALDAFFANPKLAAGEAELLKTRFWSTVPGDGRQSQAWFKVLQDVRAWREQRLPITVVAYDDFSTSEERDAADGAFLSDLLKQQQGRAFVVIYSGNAHTMKIPLEELPTELPLGAHLAHWDLLHINLASPGGRAWNCGDSSCGPHDWPPSRVLAPPGTIQMGYITGAFDGVAGIGPLTASPPARLAPASH